jgi:hypothetical protein
VTWTDAELAKLVIKDTSSASRLWLARRMAVMLADALPGRDIHVTELCYVFSPARPRGPVRWVSGVVVLSSSLGMP